MRTYFLKTERIGFSKWKVEDTNYAKQLWGDINVTKLLCANGEFRQDEILQRLETEIANDVHFHVQYWPIFDMKNEELIGCCGIRPFQNEIGAYELGCHLRSKFWGHGYAMEACEAIIKYCFHTYEINKLYVGHHPQNKASENLIKKLGFNYLGTNFYEPTGLYHPSYELNKKII